MALPTNTHITYANVGIREDLSDTIYNISPEETPFTNNIGRGSAKQTYHEWQTQALTAAVDTNANLEGDDANLDAANTTTRVGNRTQIADKTAVVSGTNQAVDLAGRASEMALQVMLKGKELARDVEKQMLSNKASVTGNSSTARVSAGMESWLTSNVSRGSGGSSGGFSGGTVSAPTDGTQRAFTETLLKAVQLSCFNNGSKASQLYMGGTQKQVFSSFAGIAVNRIDNPPSTGQVAIVGAADVYVGDFGKLTAIPHPYGMRSRTVLAIDPNFARMATLRPMQNLEIGKTGDNDKRQIIIEYTLQVDNEAAHGVVADLS